MAFYCKQKKEEKTIRTLEINFRRAYDYGEKKEQQKKHQIILKKKE